MIGNTTYLSILTLNVNGLNSPIKRHRIANWFKKQDPTICCLQEMHLTDKDKHWLRIKMWKKAHQANGPCRQAEVAIPIYDKADFRPRLVRRDNKFIAY
jgi:hypothetical protein